MRYAKSVCLLFTLLSLPVVGWGLKPYQPTSGSPFDESWRWAELDILSSFVVRQACQAPNGNLWFAVHGGVVEYDGYHATHFSLENEIREDSNSLSILVNQDGVVYIATKSFAYCLKDGQWTQLFDTGNIGYSSGSRIIEAPDGSVWFAVPSGLYHVRDSQVRKIDIASNSFSAVFLDSLNRLWLSDMENREIHRYQIDSSTGLPVGDPFVLEIDKNFSAEFVVEFVEGGNEKVWVAVNSQKRALQCVQGEEVTQILDDWSQFGNTNRYLVERSDGSLWVFTESLIAVYNKEAWSIHEMGNYATWFSFTYVLDEDTFILGGFTDKTYRFDASDTRWQTYVGLHFQCQDNEGNDWFLTDDRKIVRHKRASNTWEMFEAVDGVPETPYQLFASSNGWIWSSGKHRGEVTVSWYDGQQWEMNSHEKLVGNISRFPPFETDKGIVYFAVNGVGAGGEISNVGFLAYSPDADVVRYDAISHTSLPPKIHQISQTQDGIWWMGSGSALRKQTGLEPATIEPGFNGNWIDNMSLAADGTLWVLAWRTGVSRRLVDGDWQSFSLTEYGSEDRLVDLIAGKAGNRAWLSTTDGISRFDGHNWSQVAHMPELNLVRGESWLVESGNGSLWVNSADDTWFQTDNPIFNSLDRTFETICFIAGDLAPETQIVSAVDTVIESGNALIKWSGRDAWSQTRVVDLQFSYRINGGVWSPFQKDSQALLENLSSGNYTLDVRARDTDWNIDSTPAQLEFSVTPFLWKQPWFIFSVVFGVLTILVLAYLLIRQRVRHLIAIEEFKIDFFTNISHELRTPLSAIIGPIESMLKRQGAESFKESLTMVQRNARRMVGLVNQLLEFRKVELGMLKYEPVRSDLILFLKDVVYSHVNLWEQKSLQFELRTKPENLVCGFDPEKLQHITSNLISNAIKYTPENGTISVHVQVQESLGSQSGQDNPWLVLTVRDNGIGIDASRHELIFKPFYRERDHEKNYEGSGIGLAYTYELVQLWGGKIQVESPVDQNQGTRFTVRLPLQSGEDLNGLVDSFVVDSGEELELPKSDEKDVSAKMSILVVEDNADIGDFLRSELTDEYEIYVAENGEQALEVVDRVHPSLVLTDLMMPVMDGLELCKKLKTNSEFSHIPVLMLTARKSDEFRIKGIEHGADDYFSKPVNIELLKARIKSVLETRRMLRERFTRQILIQPEEITVTPLDEQFLRKALKVVQEHMRDEDFDVVSFSRKMAMGRASLYRKMNAVVGEPPFKFIRSIRLKRAAQLLESGNYNVSKTMEEVGINGLSHFGKIFKDEFGCTPSDYKERHEKKAAAASKETPSID